MLTATVRVISDDAENIIRSLRPESGRDLPRTKTDLRLERGEGIIEITASDVSAMRAALNSSLECIRISEEINKIIR
jgi:Uncharacterized protein conserved in archaea